MIVFILSVLPMTFALDCLVAKDVGFECEEPAQRMFYYDSRYICMTIIHIILCIRGKIQYRSITLIPEVCQPFQYRGCGGNSNRFSTAKECREQCPNGGAQSSTTMSPALAGSDAVFVPRGNSHDQWMKAEKCGSNYLIPNAQYIRPNPNCPPNHVLENGVCCPTRDYVCSLRDDSGSFMDGIEDRPRFAWNHQVKSCDRFSYFGANGNYNNFPSFYSCLNYCKDSIKIN
ncbi:hypothetical protein Y032_0085g1829 [Ancylostoma ceylanicum]|uniref:BPTI/Kunitz inhibitor domain-containing protein n=1 Tax=Ancylostoma ceylanicum TaxID=53326 RepID=A0A016TQD0_9BILA|nr:hypothetical protein Y032_0085g1829 [Ancylostoma ceylanicum]